MLEAVQQLAGEDRLERRLATAAGGAAAGGADELDALGRLAVLVSEMPSSACSYGSLATDIELAT
ncbi:hypothetical protein [Streptomyces kaniharaensis]|uniref:hypothetical protein n=1 Tax=Streptomyces kaniharaensis TaxID=212423 RepID=UPI0012959BE0|nr:hypothetical protein [Streptomyces kaniharaensis]